jgi:hypothetical protein
MIGQFGILALLRSAPIVAIATDLVRYLHGRLLDPPRPAGVLPRTHDQAQAAVVAPPPVTPSAYRPATAPPSIRLPATQPATPTS